MKLSVGDPKIVKRKGVPKKKIMTQKLLGDVLNAIIQLIMQRIVR